MVVNIILEDEKKRLLKKIKSTVQPDDSELDLSDVPEFSDEQLRQMKCTGPGQPLLVQATRKRVSLQLDALKVEAKQVRKPYQSLMHAILQKHMRKRAE